MNTQWQITGVQNNAAVYQQVAISNPISPQWSPIQLSPILSPSHFVQSEISQSYVPQVQTGDPRIQQIASPSMRSVWPQAYHPPNSYVSVIRADSMTVEQTAAWVRTLGRFNNWEEADQYAQNFANNNIWGYLLQKLTNDALKNELGIVKYGHRLEIMLAIRCLFPCTSASNHLLDKDTDYKEEAQSPMLESLGEVGSLVGEGSPVQYDRSPSLNSTMAYSPRNKAFEPEEHQKEVMKWVGSKAGPVAAVKSSSTTLNVRVSSARARPTNPVVYKTLRKVKLRSGKSGHAKDIGYLPKGSVVVINQIKGRSGRVVFQQEDGGFKKAGWVTLYTQDKQQLLKKFYPKMEDQAVKVSSIYVE